VGAVRSRNLKQKIRGICLGLTATYNLALVATFLALGEVTRSGGDIQQIIDASNRKPQAEQNSQYGESPEQACIHFGK